MSVKCDKCGKTMPTSKILEQHIKKSHGGDMSQEKDVVKPEAEVKEEVVSTPEPVKVETKVEPVLTPAPISTHGDSDLVEVATADGRKVMVPASAVASAPEAPSGANRVQFSGKMTDIISADNRDLEVSVNGVSFKGKVISVPVELEGEVRRILENGGFYIKN